MEVWFCVYCDRYHRIEAGLLRCHSQSGGLERTFAVQQDQVSAGAGGGGKLERRSRHRGGYLR